MKNLTLFAQLLVLVLLSVGCDTGITYYSCRNYGLGPCQPVELPQTGVVPLVGDYDVQSVSGDNYLITPFTEMSVVKSTYYENTYFVEGPVSTDVVRNGGFGSSAGDGNTACPLVGYYFYGAFIEPDRAEGYFRYMQYCSKKYAGDDFVATLRK